MNVLLPLRDGSTPSTIPVTASGLSQASALGRSPKPLPKSRAGLKTSKDSAPIFARPVPPASQPKATEKMVSCSALVKNWYLSVSSRLPKPLSVLPLAAGSRRVQSPPKVRPRLGKIRLENSPETVVFWHLGGRAGGREPAHEQARPIVGRGLRVRGGGGHGAFVRLNRLTQVVNRMLAPLEGENAEKQREGEGARRARTPGGGGAENDHGSQKGQPADAGGDGRRHVVRDRRRRRADRLRRRGDGGA